MPTTADRTSFHDTDECLDTATLLDRVCHRDGTALAVLMARHSAAVFRAARRRLPTTETAQDVVQEVFLALWAQPDRVDLARGSLESYLVTLASRRAIDAGRAEAALARRQFRHWRLDAQDRGAQPDIGSVVAQAQWDAWTRQRLTDSLRGLTDAQRTVVQLAYGDGMTYRQVAEHLRIPEGTAKSRIRSALSALRHSLTLAA